MLVVFLKLLWVHSAYVKHDIDESMSIQYEIQGDSIEFTYKCPHGWCGLGIGHEMSNSDMMVVLFPEGSPPELKDCWAEITATPPDDTSLGGENNLALKKFSIKSGFFEYTFTRKLKTGDKFDNEIELDSEMEFSYAYHSNVNTFSKHAKVGTGTIVFSENLKNAKITLGEDYIDETELHEGLARLSWTYFAPFAVMVARYGKWSPFWYWIHLVLFTSVTLITVYTAYSMITLKENVYEDIEDKAQLGHSRIGYTITSLVIGESLFGLLARWFIGYTKLSGMSATIRRMHKFLGWSLLLFAYYNVSLGEYIYEDDFFLYHWVVLVLLFLALEFWHRTRPIRPIFDSRIQSLETVTYEEVIHRIEEGEELVFYDNLVLSVKQFKYSHPGGAFVIHEAIGEDMGKYLFGCSSYGGDMYPFYHSNPAVDMTLRLAIAKLSHPSGFFSGTDEELVEMPFTLHSKTLIAENTFLFTLTHPSILMEHQPRKFE